MSNSSLDATTDGHVHTSYCHHATGRMEEYVQTAINKKLSGVIFLEHMEEGIVTPRTTWLSEEDFDSYIAEGEKLAERYESAIKVGLGVEVGYNEEHLDRLNSRLQKRSWDRIGISCHFTKLPHIDHHLNLVSKNDPRLYTLTPSEAERLVNDYYTNLIHAAKSLPGDVLCHMDAVFRYLPLHQNIHLSTELFEELLDTLENQSIAVEINTSGLAIRDEFFPSYPMLQQIVQRDIELVAGSDAHRPEDVGNHFEKLQPFLEKAYQ